MYFFFKRLIFSFMNIASKTWNPARKPNANTPSLSTCYNQLLAAAPRAPHSQHRVTACTGLGSARLSAFMGAEKSAGAVAPRQWGEPRPSCRQSRGSEPHSPPGSHVSWAGKHRASGPVTPKCLPCVRGSLPFTALVSGLSLTVPLILSMAFTWGRPLRSYCMQVEGRSSNLWFL